ncbi:MAG: nuclear transport factor 2 family protein [Pseudomonadota bacterium]
MRAVCLVVLASCLAVSAHAGAAPPRANEASAAKLVRQKFTAFERHDVGGIKATYAADAVLHSPDYPKLEGNGPIADTYRKLFTAIPDAKDNIKTFDVIGGRVYVQFVLEGHWGGAANKALHVPIMSVYTVQGGYIVNDATYYDRKAP